jgi:hypothetical protein
VTVEPKWLSPEWLRARAADALVCATDFSTERICPMNRERLFNATHRCVLVGDHVVHRCQCGETKERKR